MTKAERTYVSAIIDRARRAQLEMAGGYTHVENDAREHDRRTAGVRWRRLHLERPFVEKREVGWMTETWAHPADR